MNKLFSSLLYVFMICHSFPANGGEDQALQEKNSSLNILSWNIYMRPTFLLDKKAVCRAELITDTLLKSNYDVIIFQEAFNKKAVAVLQQLKKKYPYDIGPVNRKKGKTSMSSGVWIWSKYPFQLVDSVKFKDAAGSDKLASKGAVLVQIEKERQKIQFIGTHLQANEGVKYRQIREGQMEDIRQLLDQYAENNIPQLVLGDLNTIGPELEAYIKMLALLDSEDGDLQEEMIFSYDGNDNSLAKAGSRELLDYGLVRPNDFELQHQRTIMVFKKSGCWKKKDDLSDHYAIDMEISW